MTTTATDPDDIVYDAEIIDDRERLLLAAAAGAPATYRLTRHTILAEGEMPPHANLEPPFTTKDFKVPDRVKKRITERGARNTRVNCDSTRTRFEQWCVKEGRIAQPTTTTGCHVLRLSHGDGEAGRQQVQPGQPARLLLTDREGGTAGRLPRPRDDRGLPAGGIHPGLRHPPGRTAPAPRRLPVRHRSARPRPVPPRAQRTQLVRRVHPVPIA